MHMSHRKYKDMGGRQEASVDFHTNGHWQAVQEILGIWFNNTEVKGLNSRNRVVTIIVDDLTDSQQHCMVNWLWYM